MKKKALFVANTGFSLFHFRLPLMRRLQDCGWSVVAAANEESSFASRFHQEGIRFVNVTMDHKGTNPLSDFSLMLRLKSLYSVETPDLVHHFTIKPVIFGSLAAKWAHIPIIVNTITGLGYVFKKGGLLMHLTMGLYRLALSGRPRVIFQNENDRRLFISHRLVKESRARVILGSGVDTGALSPAPVKRENGHLRFLMVSRMLWSKGVEEYVRAAEIVKKQFPHTRFIMAGGASGGGAKGNPEAVPVEWLEKINRAGSVHWVGRIPFEEVMALLDESDVFVAPSYYPEGVPRSLIEAASKAKPIVTTDMPGCRDVVMDGFNGFLVPPKGVDSLVECFLRFIRDPELAIRLGEAGRRRAVELFDEKIILGQTADVYREAGASQAFLLSLSL